MTRYNVIGVGEVLWDFLPTGPRLGGAPANFACHASRLGAHAKVVTRIGNDDFGQATLRHFEEMGISHDAVQVDDCFPTGRATVTVQPDGSPRFTIETPSAWDCLAFTQEARQAASAAHALCFGSLAQRQKTSATAIRQILEAAPADALKIFDINLRQTFYTPEIILDSLRLANVLKLNDEELPALAAICHLRGTEREQIERLAADFNLRLIALTRGPRGSLLYSAGAWSEFPGRPVQVIDTVGAGDSFTAALAMGLLHRLPLAETHQIATEVATFVCTHPGATPPLPTHFQSLFHTPRISVL